MSAAYVVEYSKKVLVDDDLCLYFIKKFDQYLHTK